MKNENMYFTMDKIVCDKSIHPPTVPWSSEFRLSYTTTDIIELCFFSFAILVGTVGNTLVIKHFAFGDSSDRPGSRLVIVLAVIDFVSSIWIPSIVLIRIIYRLPNKFTHWPSEEMTWKLAMLYPSLLYATSWLLLAISLERARAIYRPFSGKMQTKIVLPTTGVILICSCALSLHEAVNIRCLKGISLYLKPTTFQYTKCFYDIPLRDHFINLIVTNVLGIWLPMVLITIVYIMMYMELKKQAEIRQRTSSQDSQAQMTRISRTFTMVIAAFHICYLPTSIQNMIYFEYFYRNKSVDGHLYSTTQTVTTFLMFSNSFLNPIIYSKIHEKIYGCIKRFIIACRHTYCRKKNQNGSQISSGATKQNTFTKTSTEKTNQVLNEHIQLHDHKSSYHGPERELQHSETRDNEICAESKDEMYELNVQVTVL